MNEKPIPPSSASSEPTTGPLRPEFDATNSRFDPLQALYKGPSTSVPRKDVKIYDNLAQFDNALQKLGVTSVGSIQPPSAPKPTKAKDTDDVLFGMAGRNFLAHQAPIPTVIKRKHNRSIFNNLNEKMEGPLEALRSYAERGQRVKVYVRKKKGVRGVTTGILKIFDRSWNILLEDACEMWKRRKYKYSENPGVVPVEATDCSERLQRFGIKLPEMQVKSVDRKYVECQRRSKQLLIRGEHVVLIAASDRE